MKKNSLLGVVMLLMVSLSAMAQSVDVASTLRDSILVQITGAQFAANQSTRSILDFGAKGDGKKDCKPAFDKAMRQAAKQKNGMHLVVPKGEYLVCGPIHLVSNIHLELQEGATVRFSPKPDYYLPIVPTSWEGTFCQNYSPFIYGYKLKNVAITGKGTIDGDASETFAKWRDNQKADLQLSRKMNHEETPIAQRNFGKGHILRPQLIQLFDCEGITLSDFFMTNSPFWCVHLLMSENIVCRALRYDAKLVNNDGIDPEMSRNILIEDVDFNNGDDNVAVKAGRDNDGWKGRPTENIVIRNCRFKGLHGVVMGSEMSGGIQNVVIENCTYNGYCKRGFYVKTNPNRGGFVKNIYLRNVEFDEVEDLFYVTSLYANEGLDDNHYANVRNIHVDNMRCRKVRQAAIVLQGTEAMPLRDITFNNVEVGECKVGFSSNNTEDIILRNCHIGGRVTGAPTQVTEKDNIFK